MMGIFLDFFYCSLGTRMALWNLDMLLKSAKIFSLRPAATWNLRHPPVRVRVTQWNMRQKYTLQQQAAARSFPAKLWFTCCFSACYSSGIEEVQIVDTCTCGAEGRAHKRGCPLSYRNRKPGRTLFPASDSGAPAAPSVPSSPERHAPVPLEDNVKPEVEVGDCVCIHGRNVGDFHVPCRIVGEFAGRYQLYIQLESLYKRYIMYLCTMLLYLFVGFASLRQFVKPFLPQQLFCLSPIWAREQKYLNTFLSQPTS